MVKRYRFSLLFSVLLFMLMLAIGGCTASTSTHKPSTAQVAPSATISNKNSGIQNVSVQGASSLIQQNRNNPDFIILDVRTADEFNSGHISGATNIDIYSPDFTSQIGRLDRNKGYLVYCRSGNRSAQAVQTMLNLGFGNIYHMVDGINQWKTSGYPVE